MMELWGRDIPVPEEWAESDDYIGRPGSTNDLGDISGGYISFLYAMAAYDNEDVPLDRMKASPVYPRLSAQKAKEREQREKTIEEKMDKIRKEMADEAHVHDQVQQARRHKRSSSRNNPRSSSRTVNPSASRVERVRRPTLQEEAVSRAEGDFQSLQALHEVARTVARLRANAGPKGSRTSLGSVIEAWRHPEDLNPSNEVVHWPREHAPRTSCGNHYKYSIKDHWGKPTGNRAVLITNSPEKITCKTCGRIVASVIGPLGPQMSLDI